MKMKRCIRTRKLLRKPRASISLRVRIFECKLILRAIERARRVFLSKLRRSEETLKVLCSKLATDLPSFFRLDKYPELFASSIPIDGVERTTGVLSRGMIVFLGFVKPMRLFLGR